MKFPRIHTVQHPLDFAIGIMDGADRPGRQLSQYCEAVPDRDLAGATRWYWCAGFFVASVEHGHWSGYKFFAGGEAMYVVALV
jgi:hypothetical protein